MKIMKYQRRLCLTLLSVFLLVNVAGCGNDKASETRRNESQTVGISRQGIYDESEKVAEDYRSIYEQAIKENSLTAKKNCLP